MHQTGVDGIEEVSGHISVYIIFQILSGKHTKSLTTTEVSALPGNYRNCDCSGDASAERMGLRSGTGKMESPQGEEADYFCHNESKHRSIQFSAKKTPKQTAFIQEQGLNRF